MKKRFRAILVSLLVIALLPVVSLALMSFFSHKPDNLGVVNGRLSDCPSSPNCVCTQAIDPDHRIEPIHFSGSPAGVRCERDWRCLRVAGAMDFSLIGVLASLIGPLAEASISVFALSTFDTDYLLVKESNFEQAKTVLRQAGHAIDRGAGK